MNANGTFPVRQPQRGSKTRSARASRRAAPPRAAPHHRSRRDSPRGERGSRARSDAGEDLLLEKQSVLLELERLRGQGATLSKQYTLMDRIEDMEFEVRRHLLNAEERRSVEFVRDSMRLMFTGVEIANGKLGPFLDLDGWAADVGKDINKYDSALSRLNRKYWRRSAMSPKMELAVGVLGSMGMFHFQKRVMGGVGNVGGKFAASLAPATRPKVASSSRPAPADLRELSSDDEELPSVFM